MAKFGEGDSRWIVDDREDGTNVNAWHWTEKDVTPQAKAKLTDLVEGVSLFKDPTTEVNISSLDTFTGEVNVHSRKGKIMVLYEMNIKLKWKGKVTYPDDAEEEDFEVEGTIHLPEVETDDDNYEINVSLDKKKNLPERKRVRDVVAQAAPSIVKPLIGRMLDDMKALAGVKLPAKTNSNGSMKSTTVDPVTPVQVEKPKKKADMKTVNVSMDFSAPRGELFECFMDQGRVSMFTQSDCKIGRDAGSEFSLFGGSVSGKQIEIVPGEKIVQTWRFDNWASGHVSTVTLTFNDGGSGTLLKLKQVDVPADEVERVRFGWENQFWSRIKQCFGFSYTKK